MPGLGVEGGDRDRRQYHRTRPGWSEGIAERSGRRIDSFQDVWHRLNAKPGVKIDHSLRSGARTLPQAAGPVILIRTPASARIGEL